MTNTLCRKIALALVMLALTQPWLAQAQPLDEGPGKLTLEIDGKSIEVFTYKPANYKKGPLIVVCHGVLRNAEDYRNFAANLADQQKAIVAAPCFDDDRFPEDAYQFAGVTKDGQVQPAEKWTTTTVQKIVDHIREQEHRPTLRYYLLGHSAGAQFLTRLSGMSATTAERIVIANPGSLLFPTRDLPYPYGFGGLPDDLSDDLILQRYLAQPITLYLGVADTETDALPRNELAQRQGATRYERGHNCYRAAAELAASRGWTLNWKLVEAPGVGHDAEAMFQHANATQALREPGDLDSALPEILVDESEEFEMFEDFDEDELPG